jgi:CheY-like chemotaxis protein
MTGGEANGARATGQITAADGTPPKVAIVGGSASGALVASMLCGQFGCKAIVTPTGEAVLGLLRSETHVDLVLIDLSVPDMEGIVAVQLIRAMGARGALPVVALVADKSEISGNRARAAGFAAAVVKPYSPRELFGAIEHALARAAQRALEA